MDYEEMKRRQEERIIQLNLDANPPIDMGGQLVVMQRPFIYFNSAFLP